MDDFYGLKKRPPNDNYRAENKELVTKLVHTKSATVDPQFIGSEMKTKQAKNQRTQEITEVLKSTRKQESHYAEQLNDTQLFEERYIVKHDEDSEMKKLGFSYGPLENSLISYSVNQSFINQVQYQGIDSNNSKGTPQPPKGEQAKKQSAFKAEIRELQEPNESWSRQLTNRNSHDTGNGAEADARQSIDIKNSKISLGSKQFEDQDLELPQPLLPPEKTASNTRNKSSLRKKSPEESFNRLYKNGIQMKQKHAQAALDNYNTRSQQEIEECLEIPRISEISNAVAQAMPSRQKKQNGVSQFQQYSTEWQKVRNAKIEEKRKQIEQKEADFFKPKINNKKHLPSNYKNPVSGYYDKINKYFSKKEILDNISRQKPIGVPKINQMSQELTADGTVEDRLIRKGEEYKNKIHQKRHEIIAYEIQDGPQFQPTLVSNSEQYLPDNNNTLSRFTKVQQAQASMALQPEKVSTHQMLYYDAMVGMVQKQEKILAIQEEEIRTHYPYICEKSRIIAQNRSLQDLIFDSKKLKQQESEERKHKTIEEENPQNQAISKDKLQNFIKRNYDFEREKRENNQRKVKEKSEQDFQQIIQNAHPTLSKGSISIVNQHNTRKEVPSFEALYKAAKTLQSRKLEREIKRKEDIDKVELQETTFRPFLITKQQHPQLMNQNLQEKPKQIKSYTEKHAKKLAQKQGVNQDHQQQKQQITDNHEEIQNFYSKNRSDKIKEKSESLAPSVSPERNDRHKSKSNSRKKWQRSQHNSNKIEVQKIETIDQLSQMSILSSIGHETNLMINGYSNVLESIRITHDNSTHQYKSSNTNSKKRKQQEGLGYVYERLQTQQYDPNDQNDLMINNNNAHALINDFLSDITSSNNKKQMESIVAEAKRAISEYNQQLIKSDNDTMGFQTVSSQSIAQNQELTTPPPHAIKSPNQFLIDNQPRNFLEIKKGEGKEYSKGKQLMMIEDNFTPPNDRYATTMPDVLRQDDNSEAHNTNQTIEAFGSETRKKIENYYRLNKSTASDDSELSKSVNEQNSEKAQSNKTQTHSLSQNNKYQKQDLSADDENQRNELTQQARFQRMINEATGKHPEQVFEENPFALANELQTQIQIQQVSNFANYEPYSSGIGVVGEANYNQESPIHNTGNDYQNAFQPAKPVEGLTFKYGTEAANPNRTLSRIDEVDEEDVYSYQRRVSHLRTPTTPNHRVTDKSIEDISPQISQEMISYNPVFSKSAQQVKPLDQKVQEIKHIPQIVIDVARMENDFSNFLESIYNN